MRKKMCPTYSANSTTLQYWTSALLNNIVSIERLLLNQGAKFHTDVTSLSQWNGVHSQRSVRCI